MRRRGWRDLLPSWRQEGDAELLCRAVVMSWRREGDGDMWGGVLPQALLPRMQNNAWMVIMSLECVSEGQYLLCHEFVMVKM